MEFYVLNDKSAMADARRAKLQLSGRSERDMVTQIKLGSNSYLASEEH